MLKKLSLSSLYSAFILAIAPVADGAQTYSPDQAICRSTAYQSQPDIDKRDANIAAFLGGPHAGVAFYNTRILKCYLDKESNHQATIQDWRVCQKALKQVLKYQAEPSPLISGAFAKQRMGLPTRASDHCPRP